MEFINQDVQLEITAIKEFALHAQWLFQTVFNAQVAQPALNVHLLTLWAQELVFWMVNNQMLAW